MAVDQPLRRVPLLPLLGLLLVILAVIGATYFARSQVIVNDWAAHSLDVEVKLGQMRSSIHALESSSRGYALSGNEDLRRDVERHAGLLIQRLDQIEALTIDNPQQQAALERLRPMIDHEVAIAREMVAAGSDHGRALAVASAYRNRALMRAIDQMLDGMKAEEDGLLARREGEARGIVTLLAAGQAAAILLALLVAALMVRDSRARFAAMEEARDEARGAADRLREEMAARVAAEGQLRQLHKMESVGQLTGGIAHDFNNMLAIVIGSLDLARRRARGGEMEKLERCIDNAIEGAERAASLTARLLAFSRQQPLAPVAIDANRLVAGMSELLRRTLGEQIAVETVLAGGLWLTYADALQLENAILNLAVNARDAMVEGGRLTIETANSHLDDAYAATRHDITPGQYVLICVSDTGVGMTAEVADRAFDPFFTTKESGKGTGLGLSQVFGFVKQSGGHVAIYSEPGEGTTVKLYLPRFTGAAPEDSARHAARELPGGSGEELVLVVEDEQRVRDFSVDALRELGYGAIAAANGREALTLLAENPEIRLLFTDVVMPEMNGRRLAEEARLLRPDLKILYTTGYTRNAVVHNGTLDVGVAFLAKPFTVSQLASKVREVLDGGGVNRPA